MQQGKSNIVQVEFSHVPTKLNSPEEIADEVLSRARDNIRSKTVVRFFDTDFLLTDIVLRHEMLAARQRYFEFLSIIQRRSFFRSIPNELRSMYKAHDRLALQSRSLAIKQLKSRVAISDKIAVEDYPGAPFRYAKREELHELEERAVRSFGVWLFVFTPNDLLADKNARVGAMM